MTRYTGPVYDLPDIEGIVLPWLKVRCVESKCLHVAVMSDDRVALTSSYDADRGVIFSTLAGFRKFIEAIHAGALDLFSEGASIPSDIDVTLSEFRVRCEDGRYAITSSSHPGHVVRATRDEMIDFVRGVRRGQLDHYADLTPQPKLIATIA